MFIKNVKSNFWILLQCLTADNLEEKYLHACHFTLSHNNTYYVNVVLLCKLDWCKKSGVKLSSFFAETRQEPGTSVFSRGGKMPLPSSACYKMPAGKMTKRKQNLSLYFPF
jgi:hypothetical protein